MIKTELMALICLLLIAFSMVFLAYRDTGLLIQINKNQRQILKILED